MSAARRRGRHSSPTSPFGRGWSNEKMFASMTIDGHAYPLIAYPKAWTPGTTGLKSGEAILAVIQNDADIDKFRGKLDKLKPKEQQ